MYLLLKAVISGAVVALASELARRSSLLGAILISLPLTSILWVLVPSVVFFVALPVALRNGFSFWPALIGACALTAAGYGLWVLAARALGITL